MSELDKIARQIKAAKTVYDKARARFSKAQLELSNAGKAVNDSASAVAKLRSQLGRVAEGVEPDSAMYV